MERARQGRHQPFQVFCLQTFTQQATHTVNRGSYTVVPLTSYQHWVTLQFLGCPIHAPCSCPWEQCRKDLWKSPSPKDSSTMRLILLLWDTWTVEGKPIIYHKSRDFCCNSSSSQLIILLESCSWDFFQVVVEHHCILQVHPAKILSAATIW